MKKIYICPWCNYDFEAEAKLSLGKGKKSNGSNQIRCPKCLNFIPTWEKASTKNLTGRKHIHLR